MDDSDRFRVASVRAARSNADGDRPNPGAAMNDFEISPDELKRLRAEGERRLHEALSRAAEPANPEGGDSLPRRLPRMTPPSFEPRWYLLKSTGAKQGPFLAAELIAQFPLPTDRVRGTSE